jgi:hypothetical protein
MPGAAFDRSGLLDVTADSATAPRISDRVFQHAIHSTGHPARERGPGQFR